MKLLKKPRKLKSCKKIPVWILKIKIIVKMSKISEIAGKKIMSIKKYWV